MKKIYNLSIITAVALFISACGTGNSKIDSTTKISKETKTMQVSKVGEQAPKMTMQAPKATIISSSKTNHSLSLKLIGSVDISTPCDDQTEVTAEDMALSNDGNTIFIADGSAGLKIVDVSDAHHPKLIASLDDACDAGKNKGGFGRRIDISSDGNTIYMADGLAGLKIIDVSNPYCPKQLGKLDTAGFSHGIHVNDENTIVYIADNGEDGGTPGLRVIDVSNPYCPRMIKQRAEKWATQVTLSADGEKIYITDKKAGILIIDALSCDFDSATLGKYVVKDKGISADIVLSPDGKKAYVANKKPGIKILDISNPAKPTLLGKYDTDGMKGKSIAKSIALSSDGTKLYVANRKTGVEVIDVSNPSMPKLLASFDTSGIAEDVMLSKDESKLYVADGKAGIKILSITQD